MKLSHAIVAIVFFVLGIACVLVFKVVNITVKAPPAQHAAVQKAPGPQPGSSGFAVGGTFMGKSFGYKREANTLKPSKPGANTVRFRIERDTNRQASDYRDFEMAKEADYPLCQKACQDEAQCLAFTYVKAGPRGAVPHCWLKNTVPQAYSDNNCISGVRE